LWEETAAGALLCVFAEGAGEPVAEAAESAASTRTIDAVRSMRSVRRIQSNFSVGPFASNSEYPRRCGFVR
jgi:hypothetical protein